MDKNKVFVMTGAVVIAVAAFALFYFLGDRGSEQLPTTTGAEDITESATEGVVEVDTNPLKNAPDVNPVEKTNPYANVKTNPFD